MVERGNEKAQRTSFSSTPPGREGGATTAPEIARKLEGKLASGFVGREEEARVAVLALLTKQHAVFIGEPGTAKSALVRRLSQLVQCKYFYYLISKYTVPDEIVGAVDPVKYREGKFVRNVRGKLPDAELAFLDEIFKGSSETLNAILTIMNERVFIDTDGTVYTCPLWSLYGASNEIPTDSELAAFYDRFLLRHFVRRIDASALEKAIIHNITVSLDVKPICSLAEINRIYDEVTQFMLQNASAIAKVTSQLVIVLRQHGIFVSDRTAVSPQHLPRLIATYSYVYNTDLRKAAITVSKYVLPSEEALESYRKALDALMPVELREASEKLEKARDYAVAGDLASAKRYAAEAIQVAQALFSKPERVELFKDEIREVIESAEKLVQEITRIEESLKKFKRG
ncbi:MAG: AAA family ATPase [Ignisphaera sp.]